MGFSKAEMIMMAFVAFLVTIIIVLIGYVGVQGKTGCWGPCDPDCSTKQCVSSIDINRYGLDGDHYDTFHEIPEPSTLLLMGAGVGIMLKMRAWHG